MGNLALHCAEEPDDLRSTTGTIEVPTIRVNDAALALGARPIQQHEPAARHSINGGTEKERSQRVTLLWALLEQNDMRSKIQE